MSPRFYLRIGERQNYTLYEALFILVELRPDSWSWSPLTGLGDNTHWLRHTR